MSKNDDSEEENHLFSKNMRERSREIGFMNFDQLDYYGNHYDYGSDSDD